MKYDCGLFSTNPRNRELRAIRTRPWNRMGEKAQYELSIWLSMPGLPIAFTAQIFNRTEQFLKRVRPKDPSLFQAEVNENIRTLTRRDVIRLMKYRKKGQFIPKLFHPIILDEVKRTGSWSHAAKVFGFSHMVRLRSERMFEPNRVFPNTRYIGY